MVPYLCTLTLHLMMSDNGDVTCDLSSSESCFYSRVKTELFTRAYGINSL